MTRPASVTVFAVINLILGGLGLLGFVWWLVTRLGLVVLPTGDNPGMEVMQENQAYVLFNDIVNGLGLVATIVVLAASIGMLQLAPWSRVATIGWGVYNIFILIVAGTLSQVLVTLPMLEEVDDQVKPFVMIGVVFGIAFMAVFVGYYALMIAMLSRSKIKEAFTPLPEEEGLL